MFPLTLKDDTLSYCFTLCLADPATFLALNNILWTFLSTENSSFIQLWEK